MYDPQLETFLVVARTKSFNKAAEELYITPPAVVKQINALEQKLHLTLFKRTHRGLLLTKAGESLCRDAEYVIQYCRAAVDRASHADDESGAVLHMATSPMAPVQSLTEVWDELHRVCPELQFQLISHENTVERVKEILRQLGEGVDLVVGYYDEEYLRRWKCRALQRSLEPVCCAVSVYSDLAQKEVLSIEDLYGKELFTIKRGWNSYLDRLRDDLEQYHPEIQLRDFDLFRLEIFNRCQTDDAVVTAFPQWKNIHPLIRVLPVQWDYTVPYGFLYSQEPSANVRRFVEALTEKH